ncbi:MAG: SapC family protein, partial [Candidatus Sulfotelmatobacter sp.]
MQIAMLNCEAHRSLRVDGRASAAYGDGQRFAQVIIGELPHLVVHYPILFSKDSATGQFYCGVMLGYDEGENLFLEEWRERRFYRPLLLQRAPFCTHGRNLAIDLDHPRVGVEAGEALFTDNGRPTPYLEGVRQAFRYLRPGMQATKTFIARLLELTLIEPIDLEVEFDDGSKRDVVGLYTIDRGALAALGDATVVELHRRG